MQERTPRNRSDEGILALVNELDDTIAGCWRPFGRAMFVSVDEVFNLTNKIRISLPQEVRKAEKVVRESEKVQEDANAQAARMVAEAHKEAERIVADANAKAAQITGETEITRAATAKAKQMMVDAEEHAREIKRGADDYARQVLENLDEYVSRVMTTIQRGRDKLETKR